jgi:hypothetical protein
VNDRLPPGLNVVAWRELPKGAKSLGRAATEAIYRYTLPNGETLTERLKIAGDGSTTPKRYLESTFGVPPEAQHGVRVLRIETLVSV